MKHCKRAKHGTNLQKWGVHTFQPVSFKIWDNGPPGSVTKV